MIRLLALFLVLAFGWAVTPQEKLADPALEARARAISAQLRCLVCQNESIDESDADLAHDLRLLLRQRLTAGDSDDQARQFIVDRYGSFVLLKPPFEPATALLWATPALLLAGGAGGALWLRRRPRAEAPAPLSADERQGLDALLKEREP